MLSPKLLLILELLIELALGSISKMLGSFSSDGCLNKVLNLFLSRDGLSLSMGSP